MPTFEDTEIMADPILPVGGYDRTPAQELAEDQEGWEMGDEWHKRFGQFKEVLQLTLEGTRRKLTPLGERMLLYPDLAYRWWSNDRDVSLGEMLMEMVADTIDALNPIDKGSVADDSVLWQWCAAPEYPDDKEPPPPPPPPKPTPDGVPPGAGDPPEVPRGCPVQIWRSGWKTVTGTFWDFRPYPDSTGLADVLTPVNDQKTYTPRRMASFTPLDNVIDYTEGDSINYGTPGVSEAESQWQDWIFKDDRTGRILYKFRLWDHFSYTEYRDRGRTATTTTVTFYKYEVVIKETDAGKCKWKKPPEPPRPDPPPPHDHDRDLEEPMGCNCRNIEEMLRKVLRQSLEIYNKAGDIEDLCSDIEEQTLKNYAAELVTQKAVEEIVEPVEAIAKIVGCEDPDEPDLPAKIPNLTDDEKTEANTIPEMLAHLLEQIDAVIGFFPMEIEIEDADPVTPGDQGEKITVPNIAEFLAEIYSLNVEILHGNILATAAIPRFASELVAVKNIAIKGEAYARCNSGYLGYKTKMTQIDVPYAFDLEIDESKTLSQVLANTTGAVAVPIEEDENCAAGTIVEMNAKLDLLTAVHMRRPSQIADLVKSALALYAAFRGGDSNDEDPNAPPSETKKLLDLINDSDFFKRDETSPRPIAKRIPTKEITDAMTGASLWD